jgi:flagellar biosynthesis anti-sigma factor FlgM
MRIDLNQGSQPLAENSRSNSDNTVRGSDSSVRRLEDGQGGVGEDQAQLSGAHIQIAVLTAQASQLPEVRQERVQALRDAMQSGRYAASPEQVAGAVIGHMVNSFAA